MKFLPAMKTYAAALFFMLLLVVAPCLGQSPSALDSAGQRVLGYIRSSMRFGRFYPQEKVYLHLDNTGYFKGETIWFKAYVFRSDTESVTDLSHVLYVELLNPSGDIVARRELAIEGGEAHGDITVDSIMVTGFYELRAYTRYMTNWGTPACFPSSSAPSVRATTVPPPSTCSAAATVSRCPTSSASGT